MQLFIRKPENKQLTIKNMALSDILDKIKEETEAKIKELNEQYEAKLSALESEFEEKKQKAKAQMDSQVSANSKKIVSKMETLAKMEAKNKLLKEKRALLDEIFNEALNKLSSAENYKDMLVALLKNSNIEGDDVLIMPAKGKEEETKAALQASGKPYKLADKSADIKGGFILKSEKIEIDSSFESILYKQLKDQLELEIAKFLFT